MATDIHEAAAIEWRSRCEALQERVAELEGPLRRLRELALDDGLLHVGSGLDRDIEDVLKGQSLD